MGRSSLCSTLVGPTSGGVVPRDSDFKTRYNFWLKGFLGRFAVHEFTGLYTCLVGILVLGWPRLELMSLASTQEGSFSFSTSLSPCPCAVLRLPKPCTLKSVLALPASAGTGSGGQGFVVQWCT